MVDSNYKDNNLCKLNLSNIEHLSENRIENIIRHWITSNGFYAPSEKQLKISLVLFLFQKDKKPNFFM